MSEISAVPSTNTPILHCLTRADESYGLSRNVCNDYWICTAEVYCLLIDEISFQVTNRVLYVVGPFVFVS